MSSFKGEETVLLDFDNRPWGRWEEYINQPSYRVKRLIVDPAKRLSLQKHLLRSEHWTVVQGFGVVQKGETRIEVGAGDTVFIEKSEVHRIQASPETHLVIIEVQLGVCREDDIIRLEDDFGRT